jgi:hypothetical protein
MERMNSMKNIFNRKKTDAAALGNQRRTQTANEFVNVRDVRGPVLYGKDGRIYAYLSVPPVSLDLLSPREKARKIKNFAAEFAEVRKDFKFFSISRPVDISGVSARLSRLLSEAADPILKDLLHNELRAVSSYAFGGEITERQFFLILWENGGEDSEKELLRRAYELKSKFSACDIEAELCDQGAVVRLLNLFANPNYAHLEDDDIEPVIPFLR